MLSHRFEAVCHSTDIEAYYNSSSDLCVYAGIPAAMFLANSAPDQDLGIMKNARENIRRMNPKRLVLISTVAVYAHPQNVDENTELQLEELSAYGKNRLQLEQWVREDWPDALIVRLPALYGKGLKKNFLFDVHTMIPTLLKPEKYEELSKRNVSIKNSYSLEDNGFYVLDNNVDKRKLRVFFEQNDFNALSFTDSRSRYQFYNLNRLWNDINMGLENGLRVLNLSTPPISAKEVYEFVTGRTDWHNEISQKPFDYDVKSLYAGLFGGEGGYLISKESEQIDMKRYMDEWI